jgi:hypothetical protein
MTKENLKSIKGVPILIATIAIFLLSSTVSSSYAQSNSTNSSSNTGSASGNLSVKSIDQAISAVKSGDSNGGRKNLLKAEAALEGNPNAASAEKHVEASLQALKNGDTKGAISHAESAKKGLS